MLLTLAGVGGHAGGGHAVQRTVAVAESGHAVPRTVAVAANGTAAERHAASQLAQFIGSIAGGEAVPVVNATASAAAQPQLAVGYHASRLLGVPAAALAGLGREGYVMRPIGPSLALSGGPGAPRGTLYAVVEFLEALNVSFLAFDATVLPKQLPPALPQLRPRFVPPLEYRQTYGFQFLLSADFAVHLRTNKAHFNNPAPELDAAHGGVYPVYAAPPGDAHTSYSLLPGGADRGLQGPPPELFKSHRGWFWPQADNESAVCKCSGSLSGFLQRSE